MFSRHVALYAAVFFSGFLGSALPSLPCTHRPSRSEDRRCRPYRRLLFRFSALVLDRTRASLSDVCLAVYDVHSTKANPPTFSTIMMCNRVVRESAPECDTIAEPKASGDVVRASLRTERLKCDQPMTRLFSPAAQVRRRRRAMRASPYGQVSDVNDLGDVPVCQVAAATATNESESNRRRVGRAISGLTNLAITMLHQFAKGGWQYDPSHGGAGLTRGSHLERNVDVADLRYTQQTVSSKFRQGAHGGMPVLELSRMLYLGRVAVHDITPLVAVKLEDKIWVVHGNRRLMALKNSNDCPVRQCALDVSCMIRPATTASRIR